MTEHEHNKNEMNSDELSGLFINPINLNYYIPSPYGMACKLNELIMLCNRLIYILHKQGLVKDNFNKEVTAPEHD